MKLGEQQAFPALKQALDKYGDPIDGRFADSEGMTLRQYYAGLAMQGYVASRAEGTYADIARWSVERADNLLAALEK